MDKVILELINKFDKEDKLDIQKRKFQNFLKLTLKTKVTN